VLASPPPSRLLGLNRRPLAPTIKVSIPTPPTSLPILLKPPIVLTLPASVPVISQVCAAVLVLAICKVLAIAAVPPSMLPDKLLLRLRMKVFTPFPPLRLAILLKPPVIPATVPASAPVSVQVVARLELLAKVSLPPLPSTAPDKVPPARVKRSRSVPP
jgi:hypothetical protein